MEAIRNDEQPKTVLLAEDNHALRTVMRTRLIHAGFLVVATGDGADALDRAREIRPDLVVLDWVMPKMQGDAVCQAIREDPHLADTPVIMLTGRSAQRDIETGFEIGADEYITKPFELDELIATAQRLTGGSLSW